MCFEWETSLLSVFIDGTITDWNTFPLSSNFQQQLAKTWANRGFQTWCQVHTTWLVVRSLYTSYLVVFILNYRTGRWRRSRAIRCLTGLLWFPNYISSQKTNKVMREKVSKRQMITQVSFKMNIRQNQPYFLLRNSRKKQILTRFTPVGSADCPWPYGVQCISSFWFLNPMLSMSLKSWLIVMGDCQSNIVLAQIRVCWHAPKCVSKCSEN